MRIITCVKHVPTSAVTPRIAPGRAAIEEEGLAYEVNEPDLYAIEEALYQRSVHSGSVASVTVGPARAKEALHVAYAKGVDQAIHVLDEHTRGNDARLAVRAVVQVAKRSGFDLVLTGIQADDDLQGQFGIALAEELAVPVVSAVTGIVADPRANKVTVVRELGNGYKEELEVDLPCVLTIQFGIRPLRYTPVMAVVRARAKKIETLDATALGIPPAAAGAALRLLELALPGDSGRCEFLDGAPPEMARKLLDRLAKTGVL